MTYNEAGILLFISVCTKIKSNNQDVYLMKRMKIVIYKEYYGEAPP